MSGPAGLACLACPLGTGGAVGAGGADDAGGAVCDVACRLCMLGAVCDVACRLCVLGLACPLDVTGSGEPDA
ncbi:hypothetical protein OHT61_15900 [Streptomyces sp. NBC_00178]|uniref:hypothetical protein n=1 Tax=Streptomyces sp. NBC_00178 TaxID=2975672 RepID=UPI002E2C6B06|nr:hypothetical protein [Streptomyces sp. NBC_00178]